MLVEMSVTTSPAHSDPGMAVTWSPFAKFTIYVSGISVEWCQYLYGIDGDHIWPVSSQPDHSDIWIVKYKRDIQKVSTGPKNGDNWWDYKVDMCVIFPFPTK